MPRRRRLNWGPVLILLTLLNIGFGLAYSPVTSASKVRVVGAYASDRERIKEAVQHIRQKPAFRGGGEVMIEQIYRRPDVRSVTFGQNLFRRGLVTVRYFAPVAKLPDLSKTVLTSQGVICQTQEPIDQLPPLRFSGASIPTATMLERFESRKIADVCARAITLRITNLEIVVLESGGVCLNSGTTGRVILGPPDDLDDKFEKLDEVIRSQPTLLNDRKELVLIVPSKPMVRPLGEISK